MLRRENIEVEDVKIKEVRINKEYGNIPIAILVNQNEEEVGYLSPFRGYCFQVSGTESGQGDLGSSRVIGLANVLHASRPVNGGSGLYSSNLGWDDTIAQLLKGQAALAITKFCNGWASFHLNGFGEYNLSSGEKFLASDILDYFIAEVIVWLQSYEARR